MDTELARRDMRDRLQDEEFPWSMHNTPDDSMGMRESCFSLRLDDASAPAIPYPSMWNDLDTVLSSTVCQDFHIENINGHGGQCGMTVGTTPSISPGPNLSFGANVDQEVTTWKTNTLDTLNIYRGSFTVGGSIDNNYPLPLSSVDPQLAHISLQLSQGVNSEPSNTYNQRPKPLELQEDIDLPSMDMILEEWEESTLSTGTYEMDESYQSEAKKEQEESIHSSTVEQVPHKTSEIEWAYEKEMIVTKMLGKRTPRKPDLEREIMIVVRQFENLLLTEKCFSTRRQADEKEALKIFRKKITHILNNHCEREERRVRYLPDFCKQALSDWLQTENHQEHPYPTKEEISQLSDDLGLTNSQVEQWFENYRVRTWIPEQKGMRKGKFFRYHAQQTTLLRNWIQANKLRPYPKGDELEKLVEAASMTASQIKQWCYNYRRRHRQDMM